MALTPEDVRNKQFSTAKRKGYEMDEVDAFLDQVELELGTLARENADLRGRVAAAEQAATVAPTPAAAPVPAPVPAAQEPTAAAVAMLALAQKTADEHTSTAKAQADAMIADARVKVAELERTGQAERASLERRVEELRAFEREYRTRLRQHHESALKELDNRGGADAPAVAAAPAAAPQVAPAAAPTPQLAPMTPPPVAAPAVSAPPPPVGPPHGSPFAVPHDDAPPQQA